MKDKLNKKNLIMIGIFLVFIIIVIFGGALLYNKLFFKKSYSEVESIMVEATREYFKENEEKLPKNINDSITVNVDTLVRNNNMNTIVSYTKDRSVTCDGNVTVTNINGNYRYSTNLDCGDAYTTKSLTEYIKDNNEIVTSGNGIYELNNELVYRGDNVNNYLKLNGHYYRIVKIVDGRAVIIFSDKLESVVWDNRYNIDYDSNSGINNYEISRMRDYLNNLYNDTGKEAILSESARMLVTSYDLPIGKRIDADTDKSGSLEKSAILSNQYIGLLPVSDFLNASIDVNCTNTTNKSCSNYNYLNKYKYTWWTITANNKHTHKVYTINSVPGIATTSSSAYARFVFYLASDAIYVSGDGTSSNPYIIK